MLVVDDDADHRELCAHRFEMLGCRVIVGRDGDDAVMLTEQTSPDLVLIDLVMPNKDGIEATHRLREQGSTRGALIVGMTNFSPSWQKLATTAGCDAVLFKPDLIERFDEIARSFLPQLGRRVDDAPSSAEAGRQHD